MRFLADENLNASIIRGLRRRLPKIDVIWVHDVDLNGSPDPDILKWAADNDRLLLTHDVATITRYAYERTAAGQPMPGVIEVVATAAIGQIIEDLVLIAECAVDGEFEGQVIYLPLG